MEQNTRIEEEIVMHCSPELVVLVYHFLPEKIAPLKFCSISTLLMNLSTTG